MININNVKTIHCIGIGGIGLSAIAEVLLSLGYKVSGSDIKQTDLTEHLTVIGATVYLNQIYENIKDIDLLVYSAAVHNDNPEMLAAKDKGIPCISRAEMLGLLMERYKESIAVSGTHGKTTTTSMLSLILKDAALDPTILVGGILDNIGGNASVGKSDFFITEACEYVDSFLMLTPKIEILLNIDLDHLDYFKDINHITDSFTQFAQLVPLDGLVVLNYDDIHLKNIIPTINSNVLTFGHDANSDFYASNIIFNANGFPSFDVIHKDITLCNLQLSVPGNHNISNSLAAFACSYHIGVPVTIIQSSLAKYTGTHRRFDLIGITKNNIKIIDDYAHHPTEIKATLSAAKNLEDNKLWSIFQPHTFTRTKSLFNEFIDAFTDADKIIITSIYAARETDTLNISSNDLVTEIKKRHPESDIIFIDSFDEIVNYIANNSEDNDLIITMGAGDIFNVAKKIIDIYK